MSSQHIPDQGQTSVATDMTDDPEYQLFAENMAKHCRCSRNCPCDGVLGGGLCDDIQDDERETIFDDADELEAQLHRPCDA